MLFSKVAWKWICAYHLEKLFFTLEETRKFFVHHFFLSTSYSKRSFGQKKMLKVFISHMLQIANVTQIGLAKLFYSSHDDPDNLSSNFLSFFSLRHKPIRTVLRQFSDWETCEYIFLQQRRRWWWRKKQQAKKRMKTDGEVKQFMRRKNWIFLDAIAETL